MAQTEYFNFFPFLSSGMADYFQISKMKIQNFSFPCGGMANFFQHFKISKMNSFQMFHGGINEKKIDPRLPNLFNICKSYLFNLTKNSHILHITMVVSSTIKEA
jgi:hypothetical protein